MTAVEKIRSLCKERKISIHKLEMDLSFANGYIGSLRKGTIPADRLLKIADYFDVPFECFLQDETQTKTKKVPLLDERVIEALADLRDNPDTRALLDVLPNMTEEQVKQMAAFARFLRSNGDGEQR